MKIGEYHPDTEELENKVLSWANQRGLLTDSSVFFQWKKTNEELIELLDAIIEKDREKAKDAIGDIVVTLIIQAKMWDLNIQECLEYAYDEIKERKGKMINGFFVKDAK